MALGSIIAAAKSDSKNYVKSGGFEVQITLTTPDGGTTIEIKGFSANVNVLFDPDEGNTVSGQHVHITIDETDLVDENYTYKDSNGDLQLLSHRVTVNDSLGNPLIFLVSQQYYDNTLGLITCILGRFRQ